MNIYLIGLSHQTAPIAIREMVYVSPKKVRELLLRLKGLAGIAEVALLSTCNRTEIYAVCEHEQQAIDCFGYLSGSDTTDLLPFLYMKYDLEAARHLFRVTAGVESLALGEDQIQGQVATALEKAQLNDTVGRQLNGMFQQALAAGKRVRTETAIGGGATALSRIAVDLVTATLPDVPTLSVLLIGAGDIAEATARYLAERHAHIVFVANRTHAHAVELAEKFGGLAVYFQDIEQKLAECDIVISSTAAPHYVITVANVTKALHLRGGRPLHLIDLALPRDIDPRVSELPGIYLHNLDDLHATAQQYRESRLRELPHADDIIEEELERWCVRRAGGEVAQVISALHSHFELVRREEIMSRQKQLASFTPQQLAVVESLTQALIKRLLHTPTVNCKMHYAQHSDALLVDTLNKLFGLSTTAEGDE